MGWWPRILPVREGVRLLSFLFFFQSFCSVATIICPLTTSLNPSGTLTTHLKTITATTTRLHPYTWPAHSSHYNYNTGWEHWRTRTCFGKQSQFWRSALRLRQSPAVDSRPFSFPHVGSQLPNICRTSGWFRSTWKSAETFLPSRMSNRASEIKKGSIWRRTFKQSVNNVSVGWTSQLTPFCPCNDREEHFQNSHWSLVQARSRWCSFAAGNSKTCSRPWTFCLVSPQMDARVNFQRSDDDVDSLGPAFAENRRSNQFYVQES